MPETHWLNCVREIKVSVYSIFQDIPEKGAIYYVQF